MVQSGINDFRKEDSPYREEIIREIRVAIFQIVNDEARIAAIKDWGLNELQSEAAAAFLQKQLEHFRGKVVALLEEERSGGGRKLFKLYAMLARRIGKEQQWIQEWE
ncbi:hypothetical protein D3C81_2014960 [compost metagenome]